MGSPPAYYRLVTLPFAASHEHLRREDACCDRVVPLGYNDDPAMPGLGSPRPGDLMDIRP